MEAVLKKVKEFAPEELDALEEILNEAKSTPEMLKEAFQILSSFRYNRTQFSN
jgi:hypothetical protein